MSEDKAYEHVSEVLTSYQFRPRKNPRVTIKTGDSIKAADLGNEICAGGCQEQLATKLQVVDFGCTHKMCHECSLQEPSPQVEGSGGWLYRQKTCPTCRDVGEFATDTVSYSRLQRFMGFDVDSVASKAPTFGGERTVTVRKVDGSQASSALAEEDRSISLVDAKEVQRRHKRNMFTAALDRLRDQRPKDGSSDSALEEQIQAMEKRIRDL
jgi:hypothetical protein